MSNADLATLTPTNTQYPLIHAVEHKDLFTILTLLEKGKGLKEVDKLYAFH